MSDNRVLFDVHIRVDCGAHGYTFAEMTRLVADALAAAGVQNDGVRAYKWKTWEAVVRDAATAADFDEADDSEEAMEARAAKWTVDKMPDPPKESSCG